MLKMDKKSIYTTFNPKFTPILSPILNARRIH